MRTRVPLLLLLLPALTSCSLVLTRQGLSVLNAPAGTMPVAAAPFQCNPSSTWGAVDVALAIASVSSGYVEAYGHLEPDQARGRYIWLGAVVGLAFVASGSVGFRRAQACRDLRSRSGFGVGFVDDDPQPTEIRRDADVITSEELMQFADRSVYQAIQSLRTQWLRRTGFRDGRPSVFVDDRPDELEILESMRPDEVQTLRFYSPSDASIRFGTGHPSGVIEVRTRR